MSKHKNQNDFKELLHEEEEWNKKERKNKKKSIPNYCKGRSDKYKNKQDN